MLPRHTIPIAIQRVCFRVQSYILFLLFILFVLFVKTRMAHNLAKAAVGALALNGGGEGGGGKHGSNGNDGVMSSKSSAEPVPFCPEAVLPKYHDEDACARRMTTSRVGGDCARPAIYQQLKDGATGATLVPNRQTIYCPQEVHNLEVPSAIQGFDTVWIVENTHVVLLWVSYDVVAYSS